MGKSTQLQVPNVLEMIVLVPTFQLGHNVPHWGTLGHTFQFRAHFSFWSTLCPIGAHWGTLFILGHTVPHWVTLGHTFRFGARCASLEQRAIRCGSTPGTPGWGSPPGVPRVGSPQAPIYCISCVWLVPTNSFSLYSCSGLYSLTMVPKHQLFRTILFDHGLKTPPLENIENILF